VAALTARVVVTPLAGLIWPAPSTAVLTLRDAAGVLTDCANAQIRRRDPAGATVSLALTRVSLGTYQAGSEAVPLLHAQVGTWSYEGRSSVAADLVTPSLYQIAVSTDGFPIGSSVAAPELTTGTKVLSHEITQAEIDAGTPLQIACPFVPKAATALLASGANVSDLASCDRVHAYVLLAMSDGANASPFTDGDVVIITAVQ